MQKGFRTIGILDKSLSKGKNQVLIIILILKIIILGKSFNICVTFFGNGSLCTKQSKYCSRIGRKVFLLNFYEHKHPLDYLNMVNLLEFVYWI